MNINLKAALDLLEKEKGIKKEVLLSAIETSLLAACKNHFGTISNAKVVIDDDTYEYKVYLEKEVVQDNVINDLTEINIKEAVEIDPNILVGDLLLCPVDTSEFGRIATQNAKGVIVQKIREEERHSLYDEMKQKEHTVITGTVGREQSKYTLINLGRTDAMLMDQDRTKQEKLKQGERVKVYVEEVINSPKGPRIKVSRNSAMLVKRLFEQEVTEILDGIIEIKSIAREAGSRTKMAVLSHDPNVDAVGSCVGINGIRVNAVVDELHDEKIDIINWDDNPAYLIENALAPSKVIMVVSDEDTREALVIVPDHQLSLAIGKEGQNARLAVKLTNYKIDIKSETQAKESGIFDELGIEYNAKE